MLSCAFKSLWIGTSVRVISRVGVTRWYRSRPTCTSESMCSILVLVDSTELPSLTSEEMDRITKGLREFRDLRRKPLNMRIVKDEKNVETPKQEEPRPKEEPKPNPEKKKESLLYDMKIDRKGLSEADYQYVTNLQKVLSDPSNVKVRDTKELYKEIGLTEDDQKFMIEELKKAKGAPPPKESTPDERAKLSRLERLLSNDSSILDSYDSWLKEVEKVLGPKVDHPESLTEEEITKIPPVPEKLREMIQYMTSDK